MPARGLSADTSVVIRSNELTCAHGSREGGMDQPGPEVCQSDRIIDPLPPSLLAVQLVGVVGSAALLSVLAVLGCCPRLLSSA